MTTALDQSLADLLDRHDLLSISLVAHRNDEGQYTHFSCNVQWRDDSQEHRRGIAAASGSAIDPIVNEALSQMLAERGLASWVSLGDEPLLAEAA